MTDVFRVRTEPVEAVEAPVAPPKAQESYELKGGETKAQDPLTKEEETIDIWEGLNRTKIAVDYFNIKEFEGEFNLKMKTSQIDKYIKAEIEKRGWEKNVDNWRKIVSEIEAEIGSGRLDVFKRIEKISGYIQAINRLNKAKEQKERFKLYEQKE